MSPATPLAGAPGVGPPDRPGRGAREGPRVVLLRGRASEAPGRLSPAPGPRRGVRAEGEPSAWSQRGLTVEILPESAARVRPLRAIGGECGWGSLDLRTEEEPVTLRRAGPAGHRPGPIAREYQPVYHRRRVDVATLEEGYKVHFHRRSEPRPVEIDCANFAFGFTVTGSTRLELEAWVAAVSKGVPRDDGFRRIPPAFGVAEPEPKGPLAAAAALGRNEPRTGHVGRRGERRARQRRAVRFLLGLAGGTRAPAHGRSGSGRRARVIAPCQQAGGARSS